MDTPAIDANARAVKKTIELYSNQVNGNAIEGGKLRIINGVSAFTEATLAQVESAGELKEIYAFEERPDVDGYRIYVPQKSKSDPREAPMFSYRVNAKYKDENGKERVITTGYITDSVLPKEALLEHEMLDYANEWKMLGLKSGSAVMDARSTMGMMIPIDMPSLPAETIYTVEDANGNLLYTTEQAADNSSVTSAVLQSGGEPAKAKSNVATGNWEGAEESNVRIKNDAIKHRCTIIPEQQKQELPFTWTASGEGQIIESTTLQATWGIKQQIYIIHQATTETGTTLSSWNNIGQVTNRSDWKVVRNSGVEEIYLTRNEIDLGGFYNPAATGKKDYMFSAEVHVEDRGYDDDVIGIMFRVRDSKNYYVFAWERNQLNNSVAADNNGAGRILMSHRGHQLSSTRHRFQAMRMSQTGAATFNTIKALRTRRRKYSKPFQTSCLRTIVQTSHTLDFSLIRPAYLTSMSQPTTKRITRLAGRLAANIRSPSSYRKMSSGFTLVSLAARSWVSLFVSERTPGATISLTTEQRTCRNIPMDPMEYLTSPSKSAIGRS
ncbi:hypothetical protein GZH47_32570 (plasmid) [Paenibacillus rhizovicinus]|uniref:Uncharacterized protein n=1 Tax=Paenibacillus rhizovicinus TaxID=2704463 RepID=A0A6C0PAM9_9BACL|nr:hypothetical protein [Paenibacillus rhizovicinus]QHW35634.1 hypothetical protein GZH47_32570 [Paenibacillus rhizovicinus]